MTSENREVLFKGLVAVTLLGPGSAFSGALPLLAVAIGGNMLSTLAEGVYGECRKRWFTPDGALNRDLAKALCTSFQGAIRHVNKTWPTSPEYQKMKKDNPVEAEQTRIALGWLGSDAEKVLIPEQLDDILYGQHEKLLALTRTDKRQSAAETIRSLLPDELDKYFANRPPEFRAFVEEQLVSSWLKRVQQCLKEDNVAHNAYEHLWQQSISATMEQMQRDFEEHTEQMYELVDAVERLREEVRQSEDLLLSPEALDGPLGRVITDIQDRLRRIEEDTKAIRERVEKHLRPPRPASETRHAYLPHLIEEMEMLTLPGGHKVRLAQLYVSLRADAMNPGERQAEHMTFLDTIEDMTVAHGLNMTDPRIYTKMGQVISRDPYMRMLIARQWEAMLGERERQSLSLAEVVQHHSVVVLLGDPGSGKTTLGKWLVLHAARALQNGQARIQVPADTVRPGDDATQMLDIGPASLPIFIRIVEYANARWQVGHGDTGLTLATFIEQGGYHHENWLRAVDLEQQDVGTLAKEAVTTGQALVILDGLDEVGDLIKRREVMHAVQQFVTEHEPRGVRVVLTSRIVGYQFQPLTQLHHYTVEDMDDTAIRAFCHAWATTMHPDEESTIGERLATAIENHPYLGVRQMAGNPLLLTLLAQVYDPSTDEALPTRRVELFDKTVEVFRAQRKVFWDTAQLSLEEMKRGLGAVAASLHSESITGFTDEGGVRGYLNEVLPSEKSEVVLQAARDVTGLLVARGEGVYGFLHRALQEYFAAWHLTHPPQQAIERMRGHVLETTWREPLVLAMGMISQLTYPLARQRRAALQQQAFDILLETPDPAGALLPRRELLAAAAVAECIQVPKRVAEHIATRLLTFLKRRDGSDPSAVLRRRIEGAMRTLRDSVAREDTETALCAAVRADDMELRLAAVTTITIGEHRWYSPSIAKALVEAWKRYPDPAASMLITLDDIHTGNSKYFHGSFLPFRQTMEREPSLWERVLANEAWQEVVRLLYLPSFAEMTPESINRDSPLTGDIVAALRRDTPPLETLLPTLLPLAMTPGTADARDAALVLSGLGNTEWIVPCVENAQGDETRIRPITASLNPELARARDLALARSRDPYLDEIQQQIDTARERWAHDEAIMAALDRAVENLSDIRSAFCKTTAARALQHLLEEWERQNPPTPKASPDDAPTMTEITIETLPDIIAMLQAQDDTQREQARALLVKKRPASSLGRDVIETMAQFAIHHRGIYQVDTQIDWALNRLQHDVPEWITAWIADANAAEGDHPALVILNRIHATTPETFVVLLEGVATATRARWALLRSLTWIARLDNIPEEHEENARAQLLTLLDYETDVRVGRALIEVLGHWRGAGSEKIVDALLPLYIEDEYEFVAWYEALARLATHVEVVREQVRDTLRQALPSQAAAAALVRLLVATESECLSSVTQMISDPMECLTALLDAGVDDDLWRDGYHGMLAIAVRQHIIAQIDEETSDYRLMRVLLERFHDALDAPRPGISDWPGCRIALAAVAACIEVMPRVVQQAANKCTIDLEELLVRAASDADSFSTRRFAITSLSYLRSVTPAVVPALLAACQDVEEVRKDAIDAAGRFQRIEGDILPDLVITLTGESAHSAAAVAQLLGALGSSSAGEEAGLRDDIITALVEAINDPRSHRTLKEGWGIAALTDAFYEELLRVAGWPP